MGGAGLAVCQHSSVMTEADHLRVLLMEVDTATIAMQHASLLIAAFRPTLLACLPVSVQNSA